MSSLSLNHIARALHGQISNGQVLAPGPGHSAGDRSLSVKPSDEAPDGFLVHSFSNDDPIVCRDHVRARLALLASNSNGRRPQRSAADLMAVTLSAAGQDAKPKGKLTDVYQYKDGEGTLLYEVLRYEPKDFRQRRPNGNGGFIWKLEDRRALYRYPDLLKFPSATVFVCEGEKDADSVWALDLCATTVAAGTWTDECVQALAGRDVIILQDNDVAGEKKARVAAELLHPEVNTLRVVALPVGKDVSDWIEADPRNNTASKLTEICFDAPVWDPSSSHDVKTATLSPVSASEQPKTALPIVADTSPIEGPPSLPFINIAAWDNEPVPQQEWSVLDRFPIRQAVLFSGEGAAGKSTIGLHLCGAHVTGKDWLGSLPELGPALFIEAEDGADVMHRRLAAVARHLNTTFGELAKDGLHLLSYAGLDAVIATATRSGKIEPTKVYNQFLQACGDIKPKMIGIASSANVYAGSEIDRSQVQQFISLLTRLAMVANGTCILISHPSLTGINTDTGLSGNTQWHNAVRARCYLKSAKPEAGEQPDSDLRELVFKKNNYGPVSETIVLRYQGGLFLPLPGIGSLEKVAKDAKADEVFIDLLTRLNREGRNVSYKPGPTYAPAIFAKEDEAKKAAMGSKALEAAMRRLFQANKIQNEPYGKPSNPHARLVVGGKP